MRQQPCDRTRCDRLEALTTSLSNALRDALATPGKTPEDFCDAIEALAIVTAALVVGSQAEGSFEYFGRRLVAHMNALIPACRTDTRLH